MRKNAAMFVLGIVGLVLTSCGGGESAPVNEVVEATVVATSAPEPTDIPEPTAVPEPEPTDIPEPTATPEPTPTPEPTATPEPFAVNRTSARDGAETSLRATSSGELPATTYDRFVPLVAGIVNRVSWEGVYTFCRVQDAEALPHATAFEIAFHSDDGNGAPVLGNPIYTVAVPVDETNQTKIEEVSNLPCATFTTDSVWSWYTYSVDIADGPELSTDGPIWISVRAVAPRFDPFWGWRSAGESATPSQQEFNGGLTEVRTGERVITVEVAPQ